MKVMDSLNFFVGTDIVEVTRINDLLEKSGKRFKEKIFTNLEQEYCDSKSSPSLHYAGRFAAKESIIKAVKSSGYETPISFRDIEILPSESGAPIVDLHFISEWECKVSISHTEFYATASALYIQR